MLNTSCRLKLLTGVTSLLLFTHLARSQDTLQLQNLAVYEASLKQYHSRKWQVDRQEFTQVNRKKWWYYLPTAGIQFGLPSIQFGTGTLAQIDRDKATSKAKLEGLDARARFEYNEALLQLRTMYRKLQVQMQAVGGKELQELYGIEQRIQAIHDAAYKDLKLTPLEHLARTVEYKRRRFGEWEKVRAVQLQLLELEEFAHYGLSDNSLSTIPELANLKMER